MLPEGVVDLMALVHGVGVRLRNTLFDAYTTPERHTLKNKLDSMHKATKYTPT